MRKVHVFLNFAGAAALAVRLFLTGDALSLFLFCGLLFPVILYGLVYTLFGGGTKEAEPKPSTYLILLCLGAGLRFLFQWQQDRNALDLIIALLWLEEGTYDILRSGWIWQNK